MALEGAMNANAGETETDNAGVGPVTMMIAVPVRAGSAALVAVTVTGFEAGTAAGARKSTLPEKGPVGAMHGTVAGWQIWPRIVFPFGIPLTAHVTAVFGAFMTVGVNVVRSVIATDTAEGATVTLTVLTMVTDAETVAAPATA